MEPAPRSIGLRYVTDDLPGFARRKAGRSFTYYDAAGARIRDETEIARIRSLAIPPAYRDVWIAPYANAHLQATGRDARGRKQYRYHKRWRAVRDENKFERTIAFARAIPAIRAAVKRDLNLSGFPREKVLAAVVWLLESTLVRVGNEEYARDNDSFGLTTLRAEHVRVIRDRMSFRFRGKSGVEHALKVTDKRIARIVRGCKDLPGAEIFSYVNDNGANADVKSDDVNAYLRETSGIDCTAKDFRTWAATVTCAQLLATSDAMETQKELKAALGAAIAQTAEKLGNTPAVCRTSYIHPAIIQAYLKDAAIALRAPKKRLAGLTPSECAVLAFLEAEAVSAAVPLTKTLRASIARVSFAGR